MPDEKKKKERLVSAKLVKPLKWVFSEYAKYERKRGWYFWTILIALIIIIHSLLTANWLFALIIIMFGIILVINHRAEPATMEFEINHEGIKLNGRLHQYNEINKFWIIYNPPEVKSLYFDIKSLLHPRLTVPLEKENPVEVKSFLRQYLAEDLEQEQEPFSDIFGRVFKL